jgi:hypothetical protein
MAYEDDIAKLSAEMKKLNDDSKREGAERLLKSSSKADRADGAASKGKTRGRFL